MTTDFGLGRTNYQRLRDIIRNDILTGRFEAGARLKVSELVERYGLSPMPIREALQQLQGEGLVVLSANKGASVRRIDEKLLWQMYEVRKAVEMFFVAELAARVTLLDIERLRAMLAAQDVTIAAADEERLQELDLEFHSYIAGSTQNGEALAIIRRSYDFTRPLRLRFGRSAEQRQRIPRDHAAIVEAIAQADGPLAARLVSAHINSAFTDLAKAMRLGDDAEHRMLPVAAGG